MRVHLRAFGRDTNPNLLGWRVPGFAACPLALRLYRTADRTGPAAWRSEAAAPALACPAVRRAFDGADASAEWPVPALLGDSLAAGRYHFGYAVRLADGRALEYAAGGAYLTADAAPPTRDRAALRVTAAPSEVAGRAPRQLRARVTVTNAGPRPVAFEHGACALALRLFRTPERAGRPVWRSEYRGPAGADPRQGGYACTAQLLLQVLAPGDSVVFPAAIPLAEVLADSLPDGRYHVAAELTLLDDALPADRWETRHALAAGAVDLVRAPDPLPNSRARDGLTYVATTRVARGPAGADTVRTLVLVTNTGTARAEAEATRDCPVVASAYASAALRDAVPAPRPAWQASRPCSIVPYRFALGPGESWVFSADAAVADVVRAAGPGRYWFAARLPGLGGSVTLAAGDVELGGDARPSARAPAALDSSPPTRPAARRPPRLWRRRVGHEAARPGPAAARRWTGARAVFVRRAPGLRVPPATARRGVRRVPRSHRRRLHLGPARPAPPAA
jgi:hypothetical protein